MTSNGDSSAPPPASQPPLDTPQDASSPHQSQQRRYNLRTNPTTVPIALDDKSICDKIRHLQVRQPVTVKWSYHPHVDVLESKGVVVCRSNAGVSVDIEYANGPLQGVFPLPPTKDREKTHIYDVVPTPLMSIPAPPLRSVGEILQDGAPDRPLPKEPIAVVFADGGSRSFAPAAAAVTIRTKEHGVVQDAKYGKFYSSGTNNQTELSALIGAMRLIITKFATNVGNDGVTPARITLRGPVVLVVDSELALKMTVGAIQAKDEILRTLADTASDLYRRLACGGTDMQLYHMYRDAHNPADDVANAVMNSGNHINDASAFPDIPDQRKRALKPAVEVAPIVVVEDHELLDINTVDEFIALRRYKVRSCVQPALVPLWSTLVTRQAQRVLKAETAEDRDKQIIELLLLPTRYLPANAATTRIQQHLRDQVPFKVNERQSAPQRVPDADGETHRLAEAAQRLARDRKMRTANGLISAQADAGDMAFDEKLRLLKTKFVPRYSTNFEMKLAERFRDEFIRETEEEIKQRTCLFLKSSQREYREDGMEAPAAGLGGVPSVVGPRATDTSSGIGSDLTHHSPSMAGSVAPSGTQFSHFPPWMMPTFPFPPGAPGWMPGFPGGMGQQQAKDPREVAKDHGRIYFQMLSKCDPALRKLVEKTCNKCHEKADHVARNCPKPAHKNTALHPHGGIAFMMSKGIPLPP